MNSKTTPQSAKVDIYARVTDRIVEDLAAGVRPWMKTWSAGHAEGRISRPLRHNGTPYRGVNVLLLWGEAQAKGFGSPSWMTSLAPRVTGCIRTPSGTVSSLRLWTPADSTS